MAEFTFRLEQEAEDVFSFTAEHEGGSHWRAMGLSTADAVALFEAVEQGIGDYVREMRAVRREYKVNPYRLVGDPGFEGVGDFTSDDPVERWRAHEAAKGRS
jgi:hypothetical protein